MVHSSRAKATCNASSTRVIVPVSTAPRRFTSRLRSTVRICENIAMDGTESPVRGSGGMNALPGERGTLTVDVSGATIVVELY